MAVTLVYTKKGTPYIDQYNETAKKMAADRDTYLNTQSGIRDVYRKQAIENRDNEINKTNDTYNASAKQNYINYMQSQKALPSQLNALGIRGGASESSLIRLGNTYGTNVANNESARGTAIADITNTYANNLDEYDRNYQQTLSDYDRDYNSRLASAYATAYQNQINWEREAQQKDLEYFSGVIEGLYGDTASYDNLIANLKKSTDPNRNYKIMLAQKAKQTLIDKLGESSGGGGGGGYSRGGGGYGYSSGGGSGSGITSSDAKAVAKSTVKQSAKTAKKVAKSFKRKTKSIKGDTYYVTSKGSYRSR